jgi:hypothetical protein
LSRYRITRTRASLVAIVAVCACAWTASAAYAGGGPGAVYNDFAQDGRLSCNHSRADLEAVLRSGSLNQYGDPLTLARLKLAVRKQLAGGCRHTRRSGSSQQRGTGASGGGGTGSGQTGASKGASGRHGRHGRPNQATTVEASPRPAVPGDNASFAVGRALVVGLLIAAVALGGWLTKHALVARD